MTDSRTTAHLDQLAARITAHREQAAPHVAALLDVEQAFMAQLLNDFSDVDPGFLGALLLAVGGRMAEFCLNLPEQQRQHAGPMVVNLLQMAGERLYTGKPPLTWDCPYTLVGGAVCTKALTAPDDERLEARIAGHLALSHPDTRHERRA